MIYFRGHTNMRTVHVPTNMIDIYGYPYLPEYKHTVFNSRNEQKMAITTKTCNKYTTHVAISTVKMHACT